MQGIMLGTAPNFDDVIEVLKQLENLLNRASSEYQSQLLRLPSVGDANE
jgi:hypothetical protein